MARIGADTTQLRLLADQVGQQANALEQSFESISSLTKQVPWTGYDAERFRHEWSTIHRPNLAMGATTLSELARVLRRQADEQDQASSGGASGLNGIIIPTYCYAQSPTDLLWPWPGLPPGTDLLDLLGWFKDHVWESASSFLMWRKALNGLRGLPMDWGVLSKIRFIGPGGARVLGGLGAGFSTALDFKHLIDLGNPVDAFNADPASYTSDIAQTAFDASTVALFIAPNPVTAGAVVVTGVIWAGTEVWDHWDTISDTVGGVGDWAGDTMSGVGDWAGDTMSDVGDWAGETVGDVGDWAGDTISDVGDKLTFWK